MTYAVSKGDTCRWRALLHYDSSMCSVALILGSSHCMANSNLWSIDSDPSIRVHTGIMSHQMFEWWISGPWRETTFHLRHCFSGLQNPWSFFMNMIEKIRVAEIGMSHVSTIIFHVIVELELMTLGIYLVLETVGVMSFTRHEGSNYRVRYCAITYEHERKWNSSVRGGSDGSNCDHTWKHYVVHHP